MKKQQAIATTQTEQWTHKSYILRVLLKHRNKTHRIHIEFEPGTCVVDDELALGGFVPRFDASVHVT